MKYSWPKICVVAVSGVTLFGEILLLSTLQINDAPQTKIIHVPNDKLRDLISSIHENVGITSWPQFSVTKMDVAHMHGSWVFGDVLALRLSGVQIAAREVAADSTGDLSASDIHKEYHSDAGSPEWLLAPWLDTDGSFASWGRAEMKLFPGTIIWYVRPHAQEMIIYMTSDDTMMISRAMKNILAAADYTHIQCGGIVGDDWKEWARVRLEPVQ